MVEPDSETWELEYLSYATVKNTAEQSEPGLPIIFKVYFLFLNIFWL